jgi:hypothetical protein
MDTAAPLFSIAGQGRERAPRLVVIFPRVGECQLFTTGEQMDESTRAEVIKMGWKIHGLVEESYLRHPATKGGEGSIDNWMDKQRLLLADMAVHLLQTAIKPENIELDKLKNNLHAILTISDQFLPHAGFKKATEKIYLDHERR